MSRHLAHSRLLQGEGFHVIFEIQCDGLVCGRSNPTLDLLAVAQQDFVFVELHLRLGAWLHSLHRGPVRYVSGSAAWHTREKQQGDESRRRGVPEPSSILSCPMSYGIDLLRVGMIPSWVNVNFSPAGAHQVGKEGAGSGRGPEPNIGESGAYFRLR